MSQGMQRLRLPAGHRNRRHGICYATKLDMPGHVTVSVQLSREASLMTGPAVQGWHWDPRGNGRLAMIACAALHPEEQMAVWAKQ